jgi:beta-glucosidase
MISPLTAIHGRVSAQTQVHYAKGCDVNSASTEGFAAAIDAARKAEVAIVIVGDKAGLTPECTSGEFRDSAHLTLPGVQQALVEAILATGTPVVLVLVTGRPYAIPRWWTRRRRWCRRGCPAPRARPRWPKCSSAT